MSLIDHIASSFQLPHEYILKIARTANHRYKQFSIKKADGINERTIEQPSKQLKLLQRWLVRRVFDSLPTHGAAHAYVKGRSILTNAAAHRESRYISRLDVAAFFPSLTSSDVTSVLERNHATVAGSVMSGDDLRLVASLVCRFERLTIGAPSSPTISNKVMYAVDVRLSTIASAHSAIYTRYADDLYFSSTEPNVLERVCEEAEAVITESGSPKLRLNRKKTYHTSRRKRMTVTGLRVTPQAKISVGRELKRSIRLLAHKAHVRKIGTEDAAWLKGMLAYVSSVEPVFVDRIRNKYQFHD